MTENENQIPNAIEILKRGTWLIPVVLLAILVELVAWSTASWTTGFFYVAYENLLLFQVVTGAILVIALLIASIKKVIPKLANHGTKISITCIVLLVWAMLTSSNSVARGSKMIIIGAHTNSWGVYWGVFIVTSIVGYILSHLGFIGARWPWNDKMPRKEQVYKRRSKKTTSERSIRKPRIVEETRSPVISRESPSQRTHLMEEPKMVSIELPKTNLTSEPKMISETELQAGSNEETHLTTEPKLDSQELNPKSDEKKKRRFF